ncbi:MAG: hypothetical protein ACKOC5_09940 [Chloroflexota bacterium]
MTKAARSNRTATPAKILLTAASLSSIAAGWVWFSLQQAAGINDDIDTAQTGGESSSPAQSLLVQAPLPTLVPEPGGRAPQQPASPALTSSAAPVPTPVVALPTPVVIKILDQPRADQGGGSKRPKSDGGSKSSR